MSVFPATKVVYFVENKIAMRWKNILYPDAQLNGRGLKDFPDFIEFPRGAYFGHQKSTTRIGEFGSCYARGVHSILLRR